mgnify:CR=1 FL=1
MSKKYFLVFLIAALLKPAAAKAGDISWSGLYRIEYFQSENLELNGTKKRDAYFLQHLVLDPKFVAADGLTIYSICSTTVSSVKTTRLGNFSVTESQIVQIVARRLRLPLTENRTSIHLRKTLKL